MKRRKFGTQEFIVPIVGQGTWQITGSAATDMDAIDALRLGVESGMTHIDTAEMYQGSEELIAAAIKGIPRDSLFIVSKILPSNASYKGVLAACDRSLERLQIDYLDCYLLHWRGSHPLSETMRALEHLIKEGKIRALGVSNFDLSDLQEAEKCLQKEKLACNQVLYNLHNRGIERKLIPYCQNKKIALVGYTPFAQRSVPAAESAAGTVLNKIASKHEATIRQVILAFLVRLDGTFTIPKAGSGKHVRENAGAGDITLDEQDIEQIDQVFPAPDRDVPLAMV